MKSKKIPFHLQKPYLKYRYESQKVIYSLNVNENFGTISQVIKENDFEKVFNTVIWVTQYVRIDLRIPNID